MAGNTKDMTHGNPLKLLVSFAIPLILGNLFQQMYNMVDTIIVGRFLGVDALAAVGCCGSINFLVIGFCMGAWNGMTVPMAQRFGAQDYDDLRRYVANSIYVSIVLAAILTPATALNCRRILSFMQTPQEILADADAYFTWILLGIPATILYNLSASIMRALGDSKRPLYFLIFSSFLNIVLDYLFIVPMQTGIAGAAIATVLSQLLSGVLCVVYMCKKLPILRMRREHMRPSAKHISTLCSMGIPMGLQFSITAIGSVVLSRAVNALGSIAVASMTAAGRIAGLFNMSTDAMGSACATYAGQNLGAKKMDRIHQGIKIALVIMCSYGMLVFIAMCFFADKLAYLFIDTPDAQIIANVRFFLLVNTATLFLLCFVNVVRMTIQGLGFSKFALFAGILEMIARALVAWVLVPAFGFKGARFSNAAAWLFADCFLIPGYLRVTKKLEREIGA